jgi:hypothetical protein
VARPQEFGASARRSGVDFDVLLDTVRDVISQYSRHIA